MSNTLREIKQEYLDVLNHLEVNEGELTEDLEQALEIKQEELATKAGSYREVIYQKESFIADIDLEIKRLQAMKKREEKKVEWLKQSLINAVHLFGDIRTKFCTFTIRKSVRTIVSNAEKIPPHYKTIKMEEKVVKTALKRDLEKGMQIEGAHLEEVDNLSMK